MTAAGDTQAAAVPPPAAAPRERPRSRRSSGYEEALEVEQRVYLRWVKAQLAKESACLELPFTILLLFAFSALALLHLRQEIVLSVESAIGFDIMNNANFAFEMAFGNKVITDVHSFADFWSWVRLGFVPLVMQPSWSYSERFADDAARLYAGTAAEATQPDASWSFSGLGGGSRAIPVTGDYLHYNRIIGGLRFRQQVAEAAEARCRFPGSTGREAWLKWYGKACAPAWQEVPFQPTTTDSEVFSQPARVEWMLTGAMSSDDMKSMAVDMEDGCAQLEAKGRPAKCFCKWCAGQDPPSPWLQEDTQRVEIGMATYNAEYGLITYTACNFWFTRGSAIKKRVEMLSSWMDHFSLPLHTLVPMLACDILWLSLLIYIVVTEMREIEQVLKVGDGPRWYNSLWDDYIAFWNMVDWATILVALVVIILFVLLSVDTWTLHGAFRRVVEAEATGGPAAALGQEAYQALVEAFYDALGRVCAAEKNFRLQLCVYPMMLMLRLFKSFAAQARLAVVTNTMANAGQDLVHFSIVLFGVFFCLCLTSVLFFGQEMESFATFFRAINTCFRMMFGKWDWDAMDQVRRSLSMMWFSVFMLLMVTILLNMLLAIIMENYMKVKQQISDPELAVPLSKQVADLWRHRQEYRRGLRVRLNDIYAAFLKVHRGNEKEMLNSSRLVTPTLLLETVWHMHTTQAERTLRSARDDHGKTQKKAFELEDLQRREVDNDGAERPSTLERLEDATRRVRDGLIYIQDRVGHYDTLSAAGAGRHGRAREAKAAAAASAAATAAAGGVEPAVSDAVVEYVGAEVGRLNYETAAVLGQTLRRIDVRQRRIEQRQDDMVASIREMHQALLGLHSEASSVASRLQRVCQDRAQSAKAASPLKCGAAVGAAPTLSAEGSLDAEEERSV